LPDFVATAALACNGQEPEQTMPEAAHWDAAVTASVFRAWPRLAA
jgi:hypothetical protein